jgi:hypothetical protein
MELATLVLPYLAQGGTPALITFLFVVVLALVWDRRNLTKMVKETTQKVYDAKDSETRFIKEIIDRYHQGNLDLVQALNEIKAVLIAIQNDGR